MKRKRIKNFIAVLKCLKSLSNRYRSKNVYLYGAGSVADQLIEYFNLAKLNIKGIIDADKNKVNTFFHSYRVYLLDDIVNLNIDLIIITVSYKGGIKENLEDIKRNYCLTFDILEDFLHDIEDYYYEKDYGFIDFDELEKLKYIDINHFNKNDNSKEIMKSFKKSVKIFEMEISSFCNRKCWFCPNLTIDRRSSNVFMPKKMYLKAVQELSEIEYSNIYTFTRYSEPLSNDRIYERISQVRKLLPYAQLRLNTNGDYLAFNTIEKLYVSGLDIIEIQIYSNNVKEKFQKEKIRNSIKSTIKRIGLEKISSSEIRENEFQVWKEILYKNSLLIIIIGRDFKKILLNRAGLLNTGNNREYRIEPCYAPFINFIVDYNGNVMPCCNMRSDSEMHQKFILGNIRNNSIYEIYNSQRSNSFRNEIFRFSPKPLTCKSCFHDLGFIDENDINKKLISDLRNEFIKKVNNNWT